MNLKQLFDDDRAVSPVIGVILMVAITAILAAVIGTFVLGLGDKVSTTTPQANFQFDYAEGSPDELTISHSGGDTVQATNLYVKSNEKFGFETYNVTSATWKNITSNTEVSAGGTATIEAYVGSNTNKFADDTVRLVWQSTEGDSSSVLAKWTGPDAS